MKLESMLNGIKGKVAARVLGTYLGLAAAVLGCKEKSGGGGFYIPPSPSPAPTNSAPVITSNPLTNIDEGQGYVYDVNATDADGDVLNYALTQGPNGMTINAGSGIINWVDSKDGVHPVSVQVTDGKGGAANQN